MEKIRISAAAVLLGVSDDTVRRWIDAGRLSVERDEAGRQVIYGAELAQLAKELADDSLDAMDHGLGHRSARNRLYI